MAHENRAYRPFKSFDGLNCECAGGLGSDSEPLSLGHPEFRAHASEHLDGSPERRAGLVAAPLGMMERCQTQQTTSLERPHPERPGEGQRLRKPPVGDIEELARSRDL